MKTEQNIRFLYPPSIFIASLVLGAFGDPCSQIMLKIQNIFGNIGWEKAITLVFSGSLAIIVLGYLIGTITMVGSYYLYSFFYYLYNFFSERNTNGPKSIFESSINEPSLKKIIEYLKPDLDENKENIKRYNQLYYIETFIRKQENKEILEFVSKRWNAYVTSMNTFVSLLLSIVVGPIIGIGWSVLWISIVVVFMLIYLLHAHKSWVQSMRMIEFQAYTNIKKDNDGCNMKIK